MGYRSDVDIRIGFRTRHDMDAFIATVAMREPEVDGIDSDWCPRKVLMEEFSVSTSKLCLYASYDSVKWYDSYLDVRAVEKLIDLAQDAGAMTKFVRVGEDPEDVVSDEWEGEGTLSDYPGWTFVVDAYPETVISNFGESAHVDDVQCNADYIRTISDSHTDVSVSEEV